MKILMFGEGVLGCNLAMNLFRAGKNVTLPARGAWAKEIRRNGLRIKNSISHRTKVSRIPVAAELSPDDVCDVFFVVVCLLTGSLKSFAQSLAAEITKRQKMIF